MVDTLKYVIEKYEVDPESKSPVILPGKRGDLAKLFNEVEFKTGAEVGVESGIFSEQLCQSNPGVKLYCIDCWKIYSECPEYNKQHRLDRYYNEAKTRLTPYSCEFIKKYSLDAVKDFSHESLDFVYIDANHRFDFVMNDIIQWSKIVKPGGIVSGHDYVASSMYHKIKYDVVKATNDYTNTHEIRPWFVFGDERSASWFWVKD